MADITLTEKDKKELETIGNFYRESIYSQNKLSDVISTFSKKLDSHDSEISQTIISEVLQYQRLIKNEEFFDKLKNWIDEFYEIVTDILPEDFYFTIECRRKGAQSTIRKILKNYFEGSSIDLPDLVAFRIILDANLPEEMIIPYCDTVKDACIAFFISKRCTLCTPSRKVGNDDLIKDYIRNPKEGNGYQSIHISFKTQEKDIFECQIRTLSMHDHAEVGESSHNDYKDSEYSWLDPYIYMDPNEVKIPNFRMLTNGSIYDKIGLLHAFHLKERSKTF